jgi:hypothetical protein
VSRVDLIEVPERGNTKRMERDDDHLSPNKKSASQIRTNENISTLICCTKNAEHQRQISLKVTREKDRLSKKHDS